MHSPLLPAGLLVGVALVAFVLPVLLLLLLLRLLVMVMLLRVRVLQLAAAPGAADLVVELAEGLRGEHADVAFLGQPELQPRHGRRRRRVAGEHGREPDVPPTTAARELHPGGKPYPLHKPAEAAPRVSAGWGRVHEPGRGEPRRRGPPEVVVVVRPGERGGGRRQRGRDGGERGRRYGAGPCGGDDGRLRLLQQPLDRLPVRLVPQLPRQLEDPRRAQRRHPDPPPPPVHLGVPVLVGAPLRPQPLHPPLPRPRRRHHLLLLLLSPAAIFLLLLLVHLDLQVLLRLVILLVIQLLLGGRGGGGRHAGGGLRFV